MFLLSGGGNSPFAPLVRHCMQNIYMEYYTILVYLLGDIVEAAGGNYTKMSVKEKCHVLAGFSNRSVADLRFHSIF